MEANINVGKPSLELSMIVRNGGATLSRCLESARQVVDEIVIADTGSTDDTIEIGRRFGARIINVPWNDDFARARNAALREGHCDWVLFLDADELLDAGALTAVPPLLASRQFPGYDVPIWTYVRTLSNRMPTRAAKLNPHRIAQANAFPAYVEHVNVRLFRRHPEIFFEGRIHEGVGDRMKNLGLEIGVADFAIHHLGFVEEDAAERNRKILYYRQLGLEKLRECPNDVRAHYELGLGELENFHDAKSALDYFVRGSKLDPNSTLFPSYIGICLTRLGKFDEGLQALNKAKRLGAKNAVHLEAMGDAQYHLEKFDKAQRSYEAAKSDGSTSNVLESKLGVCEVRLGSAEAGIQRIQAAIEREPEIGELYDILMAAALFVGRKTLAAQTAERRLDVGTPSAGSYLLAVEIWGQLGELQRAAVVASAGCQKFPADEKLRSMLTWLEQHASPVTR